MVKKYEIARYRVRSSSSEGLTRTGGMGELRYLFSAANACSQCVSHWKDFFRIWKKGRHLSLALDTKWLSAAILPIRRWTSVMLNGDGMLSTTFILSGFASIPRLLTIKPNNFSTETQKAHLAGFNFMLYSFRIWNTSAR